MFLENFVQGLKFIDFTKVIDYEIADISQFEEKLKMIKEILMKFKFPLLETIVLKFKNAPAELNNIIMILNNNE